MTETIPDERPQRRREYSGPGSTLGLAALVVLVVGAAIWWFEFRESGGSAGSTGTPGLGIIQLAADQNPTDQPAAARTGRTAPNFKLEGLDGTARELTDFRGKYVLLNFWASWCGPCREETPELQSFYEHNGDRGFTILGVNQQERPESVAKFVDEFGVTYPVVLDRSGEVNEAYGVGRGMPISFVVGPDGVIERVVIGVLSSEDLAELEGKLR